ncbi:MAG TPA: hypothetical protein VL172_00710 [Kofleriaceae bacterium]|nr:hypothetical protein [Kofleriaceae bacterium]
MNNAIERSNWKVNWRMSGSSGLVIYLADYRGHRVIWEASLPYVTIDHQAESLSLDQDGVRGHGPFWIPLGERTQSSEVRVDGFRGGFELTVDFAAGPFAYTQLWRFHEDGRMAAWLTIHGAGVHDAHTYHPHWRFDFDLDGADNDAIERFEAGRWNRVDEEGWFPYTGEADDGGFVWRQIDFGSGAALAIRPHHWEDAELYAIRYHDGELPPPSPHAEGADFPAGWVGAESIDDKDVALWYVAHVHYDLAFPFTSGPWIKVAGF